MAKRILVIDDAFELLKEKLSEVGYEVIDTGASNSALQGSGNLFNHGSGADVILLDMELGKDKQAGAKIAAMLPDDLKAKTISVTGEPIAKKLFASMGIFHNPGKKATNIQNCIEGRCNCGQVKERMLVNSKLDVLIVAESEPYGKALLKTLSTLTSINFKYCGANSKETISALLELRPKIVIYEKSGLRRIEHDYGHIQAVDNSLPEFGSLYGHAIMTDFFSRERKEEAEQLGHQFLELPLNLANLIAMINRLIGEDRFTELEIRSMPVFKHSKRDELIKIARTMSPSSAKQAAEEVTDEENVVKACRWLSVLRRDCGKEIFEQVVSRNS